MIEIKGLTKKYGNRTLFDKANYIFDDNEFIAIYGASGSGKSTLLNIIGLLDDFDSGIVSINGVENVGIHSKKAMMMRRHEISYLFQSFALIDEKRVRDNLMIALEYTKLSRNEKLERIMSVLSEVNLSDKLDNYVYELSGGEQQRIAMARVKLQDTKIILADEPTGSLDDKNKRNIIDMLLKEKAKGKTIIIATHDKDIREISTQVIEL